MCPEWDQAHETEDGPLEETIQRLLVDLSCGARCLPYGTIKEAQTFIGLKSYLKRVDSVLIKSEIHFGRSPLEAIRSTKKDGFAIRAHSSRPKRLIDETDKTKNALHAQFENLRERKVREGGTFKEQLRLERAAEGELMMRAYRERERSSDFGSKILLKDAERWVREYFALGGPGSNFESGLMGIYSFMTSPYFWKLPLEDIACQLSAEIAVNRTKVGHGDYLDIQHLSMAIPVARYVLADNSMVDRCRRLGLGESWNTKIFATKSIDDLCDEIAAL